MSTLTPKDHAEAVALFRSEIVGALTRRELDRGELAQVLDELSQKRFRPPGAKSTKTFSVATLERWYYAYKTGGLEALRPAPRSDRGRCRELTPEQRQLLAAVREEHPSASVPVILRTLVAEGRLDQGVISASSVRRFYQEQGLDRVSLRQGQGGRGKVRLRWQADRPGALWHADVCHGSAILAQGKSQPVRIHGILDDHSRYILALAAHHTEREIDMLGLLVSAVRKHGPPDGLYLDYVACNIIEVLWPVRLCGEVRSGKRYCSPPDAMWTHNHRDSNHWRRSGSVRHEAWPFGTCGGSHAFRAASFAAASISA